VTLQFGLLFAVVALLTTVTQPFAPRIPGIAVIFAAGLVMLLAVWRSAKNLQGHAVAAGEVIAAALARRMIDGTSMSVDAAMDRMHAMLPGIGEPVAMTILSGSAAEGRTLAELDMRGMTGATVLALLRGDEQVVAARGDRRDEVGVVMAGAGEPDAGLGGRAVVAAPAAPPPA
jgi:CPA2 family monovalent cation:H+ antiporter-2